MELQQPTWAAATVYVLAAAIGFRLAWTPAFLREAGRPDPAVDFFVRLITGAIAGLVVGTLANVVLSGLVSAL